MDTRSRNMLLLLAGTAALPLVVSQVMPAQRDLAHDLTNIGLVGTLIGLPIGLVAVPNLPTWATALILTLAGFGVKYMMLHHEEDVGELHGFEERQLAEAYGVV